jgi:glycosyltransferase involved in cell wall biosynthesis
VTEPSNPPAGPEGRPPTILQVLPALETGGVERGAADVAAATQAAGWHAVVASEGGPLIYEVERAGGRHVTLPLASKNPVTMWRNVARLEALIREVGADLVHVRSRAPAWSARLAARRAGAKFLTTFHGTYNFESELKRRYNAIMASGDLVIAISGFIAEHVQRHYAVPAERVRVVPRGVDLTRFDPNRVHAERMAKLAHRWLLPDGVPVVMLPGRLTRWKGQLLLVDALAEIAERDFTCLLVGSDQGRSAYRKELEQRIHDRGLSERVFIRDDCDDMPAVYMLADVVVSASTDPEAFGRVASEAQAMGRPLVAADHGGVPEQVRDGDTAFLVRPGDAADLAAGIARALDLSGEARQRMSEAGQTRARQFAKDEMCRRTLEVYAELLGRAAPATAVSSSASAVAQAVPSPSSSGA